MKYDFKEKQLPDEFCSERQHKIRNMLTPSGLFTIVGMPGVGTSFFIRFLATRTFGHFVYLDVASLAQSTKHEFFVALLKELGGKIVPSNEQEILSACKDAIAKILKTEPRIIFLFNRFDRLSKEIDKQFLGTLRTLRHGAADKVSMIFVSTKPLSEISEDAVSESNLDMFSNIYYFKPYEKDDLSMLFKLHVAQEINEDIFVSSGGHYQLAKLLIKSEKAEALLSDKSILLSLKKIYESLSYTRKKLVQKIALKKTIKNIDDELLKIGLVKEEKDVYELFSLLFSEYVKRYANLRLPVKEAALLKLLRQNMGRTVAKEKIFRTLWKETDEEFGSDWALNSLIYRLRKNPGFIAKGFGIESHKKVGYILYKN